jgi:hypothetical protein
MAKEIKSGISMTLLDLATLSHWHFGEGIDQILCLGDRRNLSGTHIEVSKGVMDTEPRILL